MARESQRPTDLASPLSIVPPPPRPVISVLPAESDAGERPTSDATLPRERMSASPAAALSRPTSGLSDGPAEERAIAAAQKAALEVRALGEGRARESSVSDASELAAAAAEARRSKSTIAAWTVALLALGAVAFFVAREPEGGIMPVEAIGASQRAEPASGVASSPPAPERAAGGEGVVDANGFAVFDAILESAVKVQPHEALLVVEASSAGAGASVWLDGRELGTPPLEVAIARGDHELAVKRGDAISYRYVSVQPGKTWVLRNP